MVLICTFILVYTISRFVVKLVFSLKHLLFLFLRLNDLEKPFEDAVLTCANRLCLLRFGPRRFADIQHTDLFRGMVNEHRIDYIERNKIINLIPVLLN